VSNAALIPIAWGLFALAAHLVGVAARRPALFAVGKVACSAGFVALALLLGPATFHGRVVLAGLILSAAGDVLLLSRREGTFLAGVGVFLLAHVAYAVAFAREAPTLLWPVAPLVVAGAVVVRWLWPHLGPMRAPVAVYCVAISVMLWMAIGHPAWSVRLGALLFYLSDVLVARDRFVREERVNDLVGHPLYFAGQYLIALAVG
jgi:uncharacterized membrane protein YhhN